MNRKPILRLGQKWSDEHSAYAKNRYWIGAVPGSIQPAGELVLLGRDCGSLEELESVAADIRADLENVLADARGKLGQKSN